MIGLDIETGSHSGDLVFGQDQSNAQSVIRIQSNTQGSTIVLEGLNLVESQGMHNLDQFRRITKGPLHLGANEATSWLGDSPFSDGSCGDFLVKPKLENQEQDTARGRFLDCTPTEITFIGDWHDDQQMNREKRWVEGHFDDKAYLQVTEIGNKINKYQTNVSAKFAAWQYRTKKR